MLICSGALWGLERKRIFQCIIMASTAGYRTPNMEELVHYLVMVAITLTI
jgi:hypothetical protein